MLAIGRALMAHPRLIMLDEPSLGLAPLLVEEIFRIRQINQERGVTILLVEQNARLALEAPTMPISWRTVGSCSKDRPPI
jgi:branched-chain amino acid transport system ATP-binding protein